MDPIQTEMISVDINGNL